MVFGIQVLPLLPAPPLMTCINFTWSFCESLPKVQACTLNMGH